MGQQEPATRQRPLVGADLEAFLQRLPKTELHLHLDGSLRPATALELSRERHLDAGTDLAAMRTALTAPPHLRDQAELLRAFDLPIAILQDTESLQRATAELVEDVAADGTRYVEIRWAPALHLRGGLALDDVMEAVVAGARQGVTRVEAAARAGQGVPGPAGHSSPASVAPFAVRLIAVAMRTHPPETSVRVAEAAGRFAGRGLTGFDLAGPEAASPDPLLHAQAFAAARSAGLGITIHAGEWGGAAQVRRALRLNPARIAHGAPAIDDPALVAELRDRGITLDLCPTSNVQAGLVRRPGEHPLPRFLRAGVPITLSTDDRTVAGVSLVDEYRLAIEVLGLTPRELWAIDRHGLEAAFLADDEPLRADLLASFDRFAAGERELAS
ncbi:MAG: adenosine deaminase family protein [Candidatus Limnocylindrales bacterium]